MQTLRFLQEGDPWSTRTKLGQTPRPTHEIVSELEQAHARAGASAAGDSILAREMYSSEPIFTVSCHSLSLDPSTSMSSTR